jgi:hypothetical protein
MKTKLLSEDIVGYFDESFYVKSVLKSCLFLVKLSVEYNISLLAFFFLNAKLSFEMEDYTTIRIEEPSHSFFFFSVETYHSGRRKTAVY